MSPHASECARHSLHPPDEADDVTQEAQNDDLGVSCLVIQETLKQKRKKKRKEKTNKTVTNFQHEAPVLRTPCAVPRIFQRCEIKHFTKTENKLYDLSRFPSIKSFIILKGSKLPAPSHACLEGSHHGATEQACHVRVPTRGHRRHAMLPGGLKRGKGAVSPSTVKGF